MNQNFLQIIGAASNDRRDLFLTTANRLGTPLQNVEKDFWVCWMLDLLFNGHEVNEPRLLFKGGTSLSKAYGLISRFSEDIDITVFREDIGQAVENNDLEKLSGKQLRIRLNAIKQACQVYIHGLLRKRLNQQIEMLFRRANIPVTDEPVILDPDDPQQQTLLMRYPSVIEDINYYVKPTIKIEAGAKSALDPHQQVIIKPYTADDMTHVNLLVEHVVTIDAERTFWDKVIILHGLRRWYDNRGQLRQQGHRISRHYYDIYKLFKSDIGQSTKADYALALDCAHHARLFFNSTDLDLKNAHPGSFTLVPTLEMNNVLRRDYQAMAGMVFGDIPSFSTVIDTIHQLETEINDGI